MTLPFTGVTRFMTRHLLTIVVLVLIVAAPAMAWQDRTHRQAALDATSLAPDSLRAFLEDYSGEVISGAMEPDNYPFDDANHRYNPSADKGGAPRTIAKRFKALASMDSMSAIIVATLLASS